MNNKKLNPGCYVDDDFLKISRFQTVLYIWEVLKRQKFGYFGIVAPFQFPSFQVVMIIPYMII